jgi:hypothetical protein
VPVSARLARPRAAAGCRSPRLDLRAGVTAGTYNVPGHPCGVRVVPSTGDGPRGGGWWRLGASEPSREALSGPEGWRVLSLHYTCSQWLVRGAARSGDRPCARLGLTGRRRENGKLLRPVCP